MVVQLAHRYFPGVSDLRKQPVHSVIQDLRPFVNQLEHQSRGERFGEAGYGEPVIGGYDGAGLFVGSSAGGLDGADSGRLDCQS